jgi:hypothetical protein
MLGKDDDDDDEIEETLNVYRDEEEDKEAEK